VTELAITRLALALACQDVVVGFGRRGGQNTLDPKPVPSAVTLTTEALP
jgi:hypothetical protein